eukprot:840113_1
MTTSSLNQTKKSNQKSKHCNLFRHTSIGRVYQALVLMINMSIVTGNQKRITNPTTAFNWINIRMYVGKVMIETRHLLHEGTVINRWHGEKTKNVPPPTIAGNVEQEECKMTEVERQIKVREEMENEYCKNVDEIRNDMDQDESSNDDTDEIKHEDEMNVDTDVECVVSDTKVDIDWNKKTQKVLKKLCRDKGLKVSGNKSKLIERLKDPTNDKHKSNRKPMNE